MRGPMLPPNECTLSVTWLCLLSNFTGTLAIDFFILYEAHLIPHWSQLFYSGEISFRPTFITE
jgi:hypothetical protein